MIFEYVETPKFIPPLDPEFKPAVLANHKFIEAVKVSGSSVPLILGLERVSGALSRYETLVFDESHPKAEQSLYFVERTLKLLLWQRGGWKVYVGGPAFIGEHIQKVYANGGQQDFDHQFMSGVYDHPFTVVPCDVEQVPPEKEIEKSLGRHLEGNRIGFDLGASDLKVSAVMDGKAVFSTEIEWQPRQQSDPQYHRTKIKAALNLAKSKLPSIDAIGGSSAGVYVNNRPMVASLYRGIPKDQFDTIFSCE